MVIMKRMHELMRCRIVAAALLCLSAHGVRAQTAMLDRQLKVAPGHDVRVGIFTSIRSDCTSGPLPAIRLAAAPAHGTVTVKRAMFKATNFRQCLATEVPAFVAFYRAAPDFTGDDYFDLEITFSMTRKQLQHIRISVSNDVKGEQGI